MTIFSSASASISTAQDGISLILGSMTIWDIRNGATYTTVESKIMRMMVSGKR